MDCFFLQSGNHHTMQVQKVNSKQKLVYQLSEIHIIQSASRQSTKYPLFHQFLYFWQHSIYSRIYGQRYSVSFYAVRN